MNPFMLPQQFQQLQVCFFYPKKQQNQFMQMLMQMQIQKQWLAGSGPTSPHMFMQPSQRTISQRTLPTNDALVRKTQSERVLPAKKEEHSILQKFTQEQILEELKELLDYFSKNESQNYVKPDGFKILFEIDDQLPKIIFERFTGQKKTKEEQIKFILRKCFKFLKQQMNLNELTMSAFEIEKQFYQHYFSGMGDIEELIPFREKSTNKTMNTQYLKRIFSSRKFYDGYLHYLEHFDDIWDEENKEKILNMSKQILKFILAGNLDRIGQYKRVPWVTSQKRKVMELATSFKQFSKFELEDNPKKQVKTDEQ